MIRKVVAAFVTVLFAATIHTTAFAEETTFVTFDGVTVEYPKDFAWRLTVMKDGVLFSHGVGAGPKNWDKNDSFYKTFARQAARMDALNCLAEAIGGVTINSTSHVNADGKVDSDYLKSTLSQDSEAFKLLEKNARVVDVKFDDEGTCILFMAIRIEPRK